MANKERNKRSARKARSEERARLEAAQATSESGSSGTPAKASQAKAAKPVQKKTGFFGRVRTYLHDVRVELKRVIWPSRPELESYSIAVIATLAVFGVVIWLVDTGIVGVLVGLTGLRG